MEYHTELQAQVLRWCVEHSVQVMQEYRLPDGHVADIVTIDDNNIITIIEVKTVLSHSLMDIVIKKYRWYCHELYIAAPMSELNRMSAGTGVINWIPKSPILGTIGLANGRATIVRRAIRRAIPALDEHYLTTRLQACFSTKHHAL